MTSAAYKHFCNRWKDPEDLLTQAKPGYNMRSNFSKVFGQSVKMTQQGRNLNEPEQQLEQNIIL